MEILKIDPSVLTVIVLVACLACIWMVFFFGRRLQTTAYLRDSLVEGARQQELKILLRELQDRSMEGPLDPRSPPPDGYGPTSRLWNPHYVDESLWSQKLSDFKEDLEDRSEENSEELRNSLIMLVDEMRLVDEKPQTDQQTAEQERLKLEKAILTAKERLIRAESKEANKQRHEEARQKQVAEIKKWEADERQRYDNCRQDAERIALERAKKKVPTSIDMSLLGGGWAFLLEFSTVIVIIFTVLILGILETLEGREIATILAAIAGYVLGKATSGSRQSIKADTAENAPQ